MKMVFRHIKKGAGILLINRLFSHFCDKTRVRSNANFTDKNLIMKSTNPIVYLVLVMLAMQLTSCDDLLNDAGSNLRILPGQVLSANIDASGNMYFMPQMLMAEGGNPFHTYNWSVDAGSNPPAGVGIGAIDGIVTRSNTLGTGFTAGTTTFRVKVSDGDATRTENVGLHITNYSVSPVADVQQLPVSEHQLMDGKINQKYCASLFVMGGTPPYTWAADGSYPNQLAAYGLIIDPVYGLVKGTIPNSAAPATLSFKVVIRDSKMKTALFSPVYKIRVN